MLPLLSMTQGVPKVRERAKQLILKHLGHFKQWKEK